MNTIAGKTNRVTKSLISLTVAGALTAGIVGPVQAATVTSRPVATQATAPVIDLNSDTGFNQLQQKLESLPQDLKNADPRTTPNYEQRLNDALGGTKIIGVKPAKAPSGSASTMVNWAGCALALGTVVVQYGVPVGKVIAWIKEARAIWGGVRGIITAIRAGDAAAKIGPEAVEVLEGILGIGGVVDNCFS